MDEWGIVLKPDLSIIICRFNDARNPERCLRSIFAQTVKNIELIILPEPVLSSERLALLQQMQAEHTNFHVHNSMERDEDQRLNQGISASSGEYTLVSGADFFYPYDAFETMLTRAVSGGLLFNLLSKNEAGEYEKAIQPADSLPDILCKAAPSQHLFSTALLKQTGIFLHTKGFYQTLEGLLSYYSHAGSYALCEEVLAYCDRFYKPLLPEEDCIHTPQFTRLAQLQIDANNLNAAFLTIGSLLVRLSSDIFSLNSRQGRKDAFQCLRELAAVYQQNAQAAAYLKQCLGLDASLLSSLSEEFYYTALQQRNPYLAAAPNSDMAVLGDEPSE